MSNTALASLETETDWLLTAQRVSQLAGERYPTLQDTQRIYRFLTAIANGNHISTSQKIAGFATQTLYDWKTYAKSGEVAAILLIEAIEKAEALAEGEMVECVRNAAKRGPQFWAAGMTYLERRQPDKWGKRTDDNSAPKVVVQIGVQQGDVSVSFGPSPPQHHLEGESQQIQAITAPESDNLDYVNRAKLLTGQTIDVPRRNRSEGPVKADPALDLAGDPTRVVAAPPRRTRSQSKGAGKKKGSKG